MIFYIKVNFDTKSSFFILEPESKQYFLLRISFVNNKYVSNYSEAMLQTRGTLGCQIDEYTRLFGNQRNMKKETDTKTDKSI